MFTYLVLLWNISLDVEKWQLCGSVHSLSRLSISQKMDFPRSYWRISAVNNKKLFNVIYDSSSSLIIRREAMLRLNNEFTRRGENDSRVRLQLHRKWTDMDEIWSTLSTLLGLALANFRRDLRSSDNLRGIRNFVFFCQANNARFQRFPVGQISRNLNTTTSIGVAIKIFGTEFWKYVVFKKTQKFLLKFQGLATLGRNNYATITDRPKFTTK